MKVFIVMKNWETWEGSFQYYEGVYASEEAARNFCQQESENEFENVHYYYFGTELQE